MDEPMMSDTSPDGPDNVDGLTTRARYALSDRFDVTHMAAEAVELADEVPVAIAGRVMLFRSFGNLVFGTLRDQSGTVQFSLQKRELGPDEFARWRKGINLGDYVGIRGAVWTTRTGERTVGAREVEMLNVSLRPLPDKWAGVSSQELRYRKRYLDLLYNDDSRARFQLRSRVISFIRRYLDDRRFMEVETPILQAQASGASARPFQTHHNALDADLYLRISPETYLKRLTAGGFDRVYEIGKNFRNEGIDPSHLQEFTMLEWYVAYWNYRDNMVLIRDLLQAVLDEFVGARTVKYQGTQLDFGGDWPEVDFRDAMREHAGLDLGELTTLDELKSRVAGDAAFGMDAEELAGHVSYGGLVDLLYKRAVRPRLVQPMFLLHHPTALVPLARRSDSDPERLDMFQVVVNTWEIVKAYSELVDAREQRERLNDQGELRRAGDDEAMMLEEDFLEAMEYGMPPMSGLGLGIDRFIALITDAAGLRDVVLFPSMRRESGAGD